MHIFLGGFAAAARTRLIEESAAAPDELPQE